ncbi:MAG: two-component system, NarL family, response regulator DesR, partial [Streptomyces sp.]|nr:two-component system, NarL family, response regulator DesR [Streptomyces sp.]
HLSCRTHDIRICPGPHHPGASGFLVKDGPAEDLAALATSALGAGPNPLTPRERDVLNAADDGAPVADIADIADIAAKIHLSESTVRNRLEALRAARHNGWL